MKIKKHLSIERVIFLRNMASFDKPIQRGDYAAKFGVSDRNANSVLHRALRVGFLDMVLIPSPRACIQATHPQGVMHFTISRAGREVIEIYKNMVIPELDKTLVRPQQNRKMKVQKNNRTERARIAPLPSFHQTVWVRP